MILGDDGQTGFFSVGNGLFDFSAVGGVNPAAASDGADDKVIELFVDGVFEYATSGNHFLPAYLAGAKGKVAGEAEDMSGEDDFGLGIIQGQGRGHGCHVFEDSVVACRMLEEGEEILAFIVIHDSVLENILEPRIQGGHENIIRGHPVFSEPFQYKFGLVLIDVPVCQHSSAYSQKFIHDPISNPVNVVIGRTRGDVVIVRHDSSVRLRRN